MFSARAMGIYRVSKFSQMHQRTQYRTKVALRQRHANATIRSRIFPWLAAEKCGNVDSREQLSERVRTAVNEALWRKLSASCSLLLSSC